MAGAKFELLFNQSQVNAAIQAMAASPSEIKKASDRAARHTMTVMGTVVSRAVSAASGIPMKALKSRLRVSKLSGDNPVWVLWLGLNNMPYDVAGPVSQSPTGLVHGKGVVKGGFYKGVYTKAPQGWIRKKRARELGLKLPGIEKGKDNVTLLGDLPSRFPVMRISHDLGKHADMVVKEFEGKARARFVVRFEHELKHIKGLT